MILVIHCPKEHDAPSEILAVLDIKRPQLLQQLKALGERYDSVKMNKVITAAEKAGQLTRLEFNSILAPL